MLFHRVPHEKKKIPNQAKKSFEECRTWDFNTRNRSHYPLMVGTFFFFLPPQLSVHYSQRKFSKKQLCIYKQNSTEWQLSGPERFLKTKELKHFPKEILS